MIPDTMAQGERPREEAVRAAMDRILASRPFVRSEQQRRFLRYCVDAVLQGDSESLKEGVLGIEVFNRGAGFDPRSDNIVRVEARRLRRRLKDYYQGQDREDPLVIEFPVGGYVPQFSWRVAAPMETPASRRARRPLPLIAAAGVVLLAAAAVTAWFFWRQPVSVAVLPFTDQSPGADGQHRADGITENITQALGEIQRLRVVSRTSAFQFRGRASDAREIGRRLGADMLVEGSVQPAGGGFRVSARLVSARNGFQVWSRSWEVAGLEGVERAIAADVAQALKAEPPRTAPLHSPPAEAQDLLLRARYLAGRGGEENRRRAVQFYERAVTLDPDYARAWGELARLWSLIAFHDHEAAFVLAPRIRSAAQRAIQLDGEFADPHLALARLAWSHEWNWDAAVRSWQRALEINPNYAAARQSYALGLVSRRHYREAVAESLRAVELDPLSYAASNDLGAVYNAARRCDEAGAHARRALSLAPESAFPLFLQGVVHASQGRHTEAVAELEKAAGKVRAPEILGRLGDAYARAGRRREALTTLAEIDRTPGAPGIYAAMIRTGLGDRGAALKDLEESAARRETDFLFIGVDSVFDPLRDEPRFAALCGKLGLTAR